MVREITLALLVLYGFKTAMVTSKGNDCPRQCQCKRMSMTCNRTLPQDFSSNMKEVTLIDIDPISFLEGVFCHPSWRGVTKLELECHKRCNDSFFMGDNVFRCLDTLQSLKLHLEEMKNFSTNTFAGLYKTSKLDLTQCFHICTPGLFTTLSKSEVLPKLSELILSETCIYRGPGRLEINQDLIDVLSSRNIRELDVSKTRIDIVKISKYEPLCQSLISLDISD